MFDEEQLRIVGPVEDLPLPEIVITLEACNGIRPALHALEEHLVADNVLVEEVERQQRMAQVIENAHEDDQVEPLGSRAAS